MNNPNAAGQGAAMLLDCEQCCTHSIPIEACDQNEHETLLCPLCGSSMLTEHEDGFDAAVWYGGHNQVYRPNVKAEAEE